MFIYFVTVYLSQYFDFVLNVVQYATCYYALDIDEYFHEFLVLHLWKFGNWSPKILF
jgi:hypothetical protein